MAADSTDFQIRPRNGKSQRRRTSGLQINANSDAFLGPTDPKYQKSSAFRPDKLEDWDHYHPDHMKDNSWTLQDAAKLTEITSMKDALLAVQERGTISKWEGELIQSWWYHHYGWVVDHSQLMRNYWVPLLEIRFHYPEPLLEALDACDSQLHKISVIMLRLKVGDSVDSLLKEWACYEDNVVNYKLYNDNMGVMLYHAYFSPDEDSENVNNSYDAFLSIKRKRIVKGTAEKNPTGFLSPLIELVGEDKFRNDLMPRYTFPCYMWDKYFAERYRNYSQTVVANINALIEGLPLTQNTELSHINTKYQSMFGRSDYYNPNPLAAEYQKDKRYPPNKLIQWGETLPRQIANAPSTLVWDTVHAEIVAMKQALMCIQKRGQLLDWELVSIRKWFSHHYKFIRSLSHAHADLNLPRLEKRIHLPHIFREAHRNVMDLLEINSNALESCRSGDHVDDVLTLWTRYEKAQAFFCDYIDPFQVILYHVYFSKKEHLANFASCEDSSLYDDICGPFIYHVGKERFRKFFMEREQLPDLRWHLKLGSKYIDYIEDVIVHIEALQRGDPPKPDNRRVSNFLSFIQNDVLDECLDGNEEVSVYIKALEKADIRQNRESPAKLTKFNEKRASDLRNLVDDILSDLCAD